MFNNIGPSGGRGFVDWKVYNDNTGNNNGGRGSNNGGGCLTMIILTIIIPIAIILTNSY